MDNTKTSDSSSYSTPIGSGVYEKDYTRKKEVRDFGNLEETIIFNAKIKYPKRFSKSSNQQGDQNPANNKTKF
jgi:hypothetical protein